MKLFTCLFAIIPAFAIIVFASADNLSAQDRLFTYTYQSNVLDHGQKELEVWTTFRTGRKEFYNRLDTRAEFEVGLGKKFQTAFYINYTAKSYQESSSGTNSIVNGSEFSFSNEWKYKITDPVADPLGFALYGEYTIGTNEYETEAKLLFDKRLSNFTLALNAVGEIEWEPEISDNELEWENKKKLNLYLSGAYEITPRFHIAVESLFRNIFKDELVSSTVFAGPGFSYFEDSFWVNFTLMPQLYAFKGETQNNLDLKNYEKLETRIIFSYVF